ncbi:hypothetical protein POVCU2_0064340 [Plasmodium ovale curtisi]|uniref:Uncharacterized protein n=1 Tax=Plasmodium ovale curtisi TaxID=864141 RepID=A0A1A8WD12_PLAOA|nr:hypothetical protein POVCU2_0064340 [Plasmodium ovale curtisi]
MVIVPLVDKFPQYKNSCATYTMHRELPLGKSFRRGEFGRLVSHIKREKHKLQSFRVTQEGKLQRCKMVTCRRSNSKSKRPSANIAFKHLVKNKNTL